jgi:hypothetical protein
MFSDEIIQYLLNKTKRYVPKLEDLVADDLNKPTGLKYIFVSASPVLINEIKSYYSILKQNLKNNISKEEAKTSKKLTAEDIEK